MKAKKTVFGVLCFSLVLSGCVMVQPFYLQTSLNAVSIGMTKQQFFSYYGDGKACATFMISNPCDVPAVRAAQVGKDGVLTEVVTINLGSAKDAFVPVEFWFLFRGNQLVQWGRPEDWQQVAARYEISFSPGVRQ